MICLTFTRLKIGGYKKKYNKMKKQNYFFVLVVSILFLSIQTKSAEASENNSEEFYCSTNDQAICVYVGGGAVYGNKIKKKNLLIND